MSILYFVIGLGLLIFIHELGHFLVAKFSGIRVERFSLGFGPRVVKFKIGETEYCVSALPLGGYVKMSGQEDFEEGEIVPLDDPRAFSSKSLWTRLKVVLAGPGMNLLLPFFLMPLVFMIGRQEPKFVTRSPQVLGVQEGSAAEKAGLMKGDLVTRVDGQVVATWREALPQMMKPAGSILKLEIQREGKSFEKEIPLEKNELSSISATGIEPMFFIDLDPLIGEFSPESPAKAAGMEVGDLVVSIDGKPVRDWNEMSEKVNGSQGKALAFIVERQSEKIALSIKPQLNPALKKYLIGVTKGSNPLYYEKHRYGFVEAVEKGVQENIMLFGMTFKVLKDLVTLKASYKELGGPIKIAEVSTQAAKKGAGNFLYLLAFLSIQLGILNLLPIPVLDGGHIAFMAYEAVAKKPLPMKKRLIAQQVGMFLLLTLMILVTVNDIDSVWGFKSILDKVKAWF